MPTPSDTPAHWSAVYALTLCVSTLIAAEFMPVSLLTPIADDLQLSEGTVGQAIAVSGLFAVLTSLVVARASAGIDRRHLLLALVSVMLVSGVMVAFAPNAVVFIAGRALVGVAVGGFWSLSAATVMRLVPARDVPRALALLNSGNALATTIAAPLGSFLGQFVGWRWAFFMVVPLAAITFVWKWLALPSMPSERSAPAPHTLALLARREVRLGMAAVALLFAGRFAVFTYFRPFLEQRLHIDVSTLSLLLLGMGIAGVAGNALVGRLVARSLTLALVLPPLALALIALLLANLAIGIAMAAALLALWGLIGTPSSVAWWTWIARTVPDEAESAGGLMVAVIQLAIMLGAAGGGLLFDAAGVGAAFGIGALLLVGSALLGLADARRISFSPERSPA